jgi:fibronectin-binding autotransporter adhesin
MLYAHPGQPVHSDSSSRRLLWLLLLLSFGCLVAAVRGEVKFWDGSSSGNWNVAANWTDGAVPVAGDDLVFPPGVTRLVVTNNFSPNRAFRSVTFQGSNYFLRATAGNTLIVSNGISGQNPVGFNTVDADVVLGAAQVFDCLNAPATLDINGDIAMAGFTLTLNCVGDIFIAGAMTGTAGVVKNGLGTALFNGVGTNTYSGVTTVNAGTLQLFRRVFDGVSFIPITAIPGDLVIGSSDTVILFDDNQIADTSDVTVNSAGLLDLNSFSDRIASLTLGGGTVDSAAGLLTLGGNVIANGGATSFINGNLSLGGTSRNFNVSSLAGPGLRINANIGSGALFGVGLTKNGTGVLWLDGTNSYNGTTVVNDGQITISSDRALGAAVNILGDPVGTILNGDATLFISSAAVTNEVLTLNSTNASFVVASTGVSVWTGDITINSNTIFSVNLISLLVSGAISGPGGFTKNGIGTLTLGGTNANTFFGAVTVNAGVLALAKPGGVRAISAAGLTIGDGLGGEDADIVRFLGSSQFDGSVTLHSSGLFDLNNFTEALGPLILDGGDIETGTGVLSIVGNVTAPNPTNTSTIEGELELRSGAHIFDIQPGSANPEVSILAQVSGAGTLTKTGAGQLRLQGANTYTGVTTLQQGALWVTENTGLGSSAGGTVLEGGVLVIDGAAITGEALTVNGSATIDTVDACSWSANPTLNSSLSVRTFSASVFNINGTITGSGGITKSQDGTLRLSGIADNTFAGATIVNQGTLELNKSGSTIESIRGSALIIGDGLGGSDSDVVRYVGTSTSQIFSAVPITVNVSGLLDLNDHSDDIGALTLNAGRVETGTGTALLAGDVTATSDPIAAKISGIHGNVDLPETTTFNIIVTTLIPQLRVSANIRGAGGVLKIGDGFLAFSGSNSYAGVTTITNGRLWVEDSFALGSTSAGTVVTADGTIELLNSSHVPVEQLTLNSANAVAMQSRGATNSWAGNIVLQNDAAIRVDSAAGFLTLFGAISGPGELTKAGPGTLVFSGTLANTYSGDTRVDEGTLLLAKSGGVDRSIAGDLFVGDGVGGALSDVVRIVGFAQININSAVTIASSGLFDLNDITESVGSISGLGRIDLGAGLLGINGGASTRYSGLIVGTGGLSKTGLGTLILTGNNTYSGQTLVSDGTLLVNGSQQQSPVVVGANGTLGGDGVVGNISSSGNVAPGSSPAILTSSNLALTASANFVVELNGPNPGADYDQLLVRGTNQLGGAALNVSVGFPPSEGDRFTIINNDGAEAIVGTFAGLPNGAVFIADGLQFRILYSDIFINDVVLIVTNTALRVTNVVVSTGNGNSAVDPNECNELTIPLRNPFAGVLVSGVSGLLSTETPGVIITQPYSAWPDIPAAATRNNLTPFQFSTTPDFVCGTNIDFTLTVGTATNGAFQVHFSVPSGSPTAAPVAFNNNTVQAIPDLGTLNSPINVAGVTTPIKRVTVSLHITHTAVSDLDISLIAPDGTIVELSSDNGGSASDYGSDCTASTRTTFSDLASFGVTSGSAPFVGSFRPEQTLRAFNEKFGADVNGTWFLRVVDDTGGAVGSLRCWTLNIHPTACSPGDGPCEGCGGPIAGALAATDSVQTIGLIRNGIVSDCSGPKFCPGSSAAPGPRRYDTYTFTNGNADACAVVQFSAQCGQLFSAAYVGPYNPANLCLNYLADAGNSATNGSYSFFVPSNGVFTVVVHDVTAVALGCTNYVLNVSGIECPPRLNIERVGASRVALKWSTSGVGYRLLSDTAITPSTGFGTVAGTPFVIDGKYTLTNIIGGPARFYELRKP